jgi:demethylmenaquinone methyltransferase/2-methoxy-6-polyprenyl-1,4-benzoquinol methylase
MTEDRTRIVRSFFSDTGKSYDKVVEMFTLGQDSHWKEEIMKIMPPSKRILDLGCGTGIMTQYIAKQNPSAEIVGVDITENMLTVYKERLRSNPSIHAQPILGNAETVTLEGEFDVVVSSYLAKYVDPDTLLTNIGPHLRSGGIFIAHDFALPKNPLYHFSWSIYTRSMNLIGSILFPEWYTVFDEGLTGLIKKSRWINKFTEALIKHEYEDVKCKLLTFETAGLIWAKKT